MPKYNGYVEIIVTSDGTVSSAVMNQYFDGGLISSDSFDMNNFSRGVPNVLGTPDSLIDILLSDQAYLFVDITGSPEFNSFSNIQDYTYVPFELTDVGLMWLFRSQFDKDLFIADTIFTYEETQLSLCDLTAVLSAINENKTLIESFISSQNQLITDMSLIKNKVNTLENYSDIDLRNYLVTYLASSFSELNNLENSRSSALSQLVDDNKTSIINHVTVTSSDIVARQQNYQEILTGKLDSLDSKVVNVDFSPLEASLTQVKLYTDEVEQKADSIISAVTAVQTAVSNIDLSSTSVGNLLQNSSLNGDLYSHKDGTVVYVFPDNRQYTVLGSYMVYSGEAIQTIMYDLKDSENKVISAPHTFCSITPPTTATTE